MRHRNRALTVLLLVVLTGIALGAAGCRRSSTGISPEDITIDGRTAKVMAISDNALSIDLDGQSYTYTRAAAGVVHNDSIAGPDAAPTSDYEFVHDVVDQWLGEHPQWEYPRKVSTGAIFMGLLIAGLGLLGLLKPEVAWYLTDGWKFRNAEPSDLALAMSRLGGVVMMILGLILAANAR